MLGFSHPCQTHFGEFIPSACEILRKGLTSMTEDLLTPQLQG